MHACILKRQPACLPVWNTTYITKLSFNIAIFFDCDLNFSYTFPEQKSGKGWMNGVAKYPKHPELLYQDIQYLRGLFYGQRRVGFERIVWSIYICTAKRCPAAHTVAVVPVLYVYVNDNLLWLWGEGQLGEGHQAPFSRSSWAQCTSTTMCTSAIGGFHYQLCCWKLS